MGGVVVAWLREFPTGTRRRSRCDSAPIRCLWGSSRRHASGQENCNHCAGAECRIERDWISHLEKIWMQPDEGIWEVRGERLQFTHSKVMAWVAVDRAIKDFER